MINIKNRQLGGSISSISSKSMAHRHIICAALSDSDTKIYLPNISDDISKTIDNIQNLGCTISVEKEHILIKKNNIYPNNPIFDAGESGTTLRFMLPIATSLLDTSSFTGSGRLPKRPLQDLTDILQNCGCKLSSTTLPFTVTNKFSFKNVDIRGNISSQYISGLLLSAPLQNNDVIINVIGTLESKPYVDMTIKAMKQYGIDVIQENNSYFISKNSKYISPTYSIVESDWSNVAFFLVAGAISQNSICVDKLDFDSLQGDKQIIDILEKFGADVKKYENKLIISTQELNGTDIDVSDIPDLLPILSVLACASNGTTRFYNASRLRLKESDRIATSAQMINNLGGVAIEKNDELLIHSTKKLKGGTVSSHNDHRIAMSTAIASIICTDTVVLKDEMAINKSYPTFYEDFVKLGGEICTTK